MGEEKLTTLFRIDCGEIYLQEFTVEDTESIYNISTQPEIENFARLEINERTKD